MVLGRREQYCDRQRVYNQAKPELFDRKALEDEDSPAMHEKTHACMQLHPVVKEYYTLRRVSLENLNSTPPKEIQC